MIKTEQTFAVEIVSVKVDLCTRRKHHFIGINFQAVVEGVLRVTTVAVNKLHERATAAALRKNIASCLAKLGILEKQIYSLMIDNGSNILQVGELIRSDFTLLKSFAD